MVTVRQLAQPARPGANTRTTDDAAYDAIESVLAGLDPHDPDYRHRTMPLGDSLIPAVLLTHGRQPCPGLPMDLFLSPGPGGFCGGMGAPPYTVAEMGWRATLDRWFFDGAAEVTPSKPCG
jgi:hypothetical protein